MRNIINDGVEASARKSQSRLQIIQVSSSAEPRIISATPRTDKFILLGDFNARVGTDHHTLEGVIGSEGKCNGNGLLLLRKCVEHDLLITNIH